MKETLWKEEFKNLFKKTKKLKTKCFKRFKQFNSQTTSKTGKTWNVNTKKIGCSKSKENWKLKETLITKEEKKENKISIKQDMILFRIMQNNEKISTIKCANLMIYFWLKLSITTM